MGNLNDAKAKKGFALLPPEVMQQVAASGGRAAHRIGTAHEWNRDEARLAGRKGGRTVSKNRKHMAEIGSKGGRSQRNRPRHSIRVCFGCGSRPPRLKDFDSRSLYQQAKQAWIFEHARHLNRA